MVRDFRGDPNVIRGEYAIVAVPGTHRTNDPGGGSYRSGGPYGKRTANQDERQRKIDIALEARIGGASWREAAQRAGYNNHVTAMRSVNRYIDRIPLENAQRYRRLQVERLDRALQAIWRMVEAGNPIFIDRFLHIETLRARLLGTDKGPPDGAEDHDPDILALARRYSGLDSSEVEVEIRRLSWVVEPGGVPEPEPEAIETA